MTVGTDLLEEVDADINSRKDWVEMSVKVRAGPPFLSLSGQGSLFNPRLDPSIGGH